MGSPWPWSATATWGSEARCATCTPTPPSSGAGTTRCSTSRTSCRARSTWRRALCSARSPTPRCGPRRSDTRPPAAAETLTRDWERMVTFYRFPREHWVHLRTTNIVESPLAALRLRTDTAKRYKRVDRATADLEDAYGRAAEVPAAERAGAAQAGLPGSRVRGRDRGQPEGGRRLTEFTHLLTGAPGNRNMRLHLA